MGVCITMAKSTRSGGLVLQCDNDGESMVDLHQKIQKNLDDYELNIVCPKNKK